MNILLAVIAFQTFSAAHGNPMYDLGSDALHVSDTIFATTEPVEGRIAFQKRLELTLSGGELVGKKHEIRLDNIAFIVGADGKIDSAWVIFYRKPLFHEVIKQLKSTPWRPAERDGVAVASHQELHLRVYLTKRALKKYHAWPTFAERTLPWAH